MTRFAFFALLLFVAGTVVCDFLAYAMGEASSCEQRRAAALPPSRVRWNDRND